MPLFCHFYKHDSSSPCCGMAQECIGKRSYISSGCKGRKVCSKQLQNFHRNKDGYTDTVKSMEIMGTAGMRASARKRGRSCSRLTHSQRSTASSSVASKTCPYYDHLDAILSWDLTTALMETLDTSKTPEEDPLQLATQEITQNGDTVGHGLINTQELFTEPNQSGRGLW